jgi:hypothetical protein
VEKVLLVNLAALAAAIKSELRVQTFCTRDSQPGQREKNALLAYFIRY